ncbi:flagellar motor stator protein MotA [Ferrimonas aestuarii]|uniref:Flagellar motor stator protein MotA n=1 Tax=Ferrimonas aestuarii TaxID=2569539 RepID=A0A4U1BND4_9GAMM|nr:flagellar motor stator protein MotA [Ferrimonas aestuarii]TKB54596.1 flagellar motor stator protein MotA [Ferrimonas aestuarii]
MKKLLGFVFLLATVFGGYMSHGGNMGNLWQPSELVIIFGAGIGALFIANPLSVLKDMKSQLSELWKAEVEDPELYPQLFGLMHVLLGQLQAQGMKVLDEHIENPDESSLFLMYPAVLKQPELLQFLIDNLRLQSMAKVDPHDLEALMEEEVERIHEDHLRPSEALSKVAEAMPGFGILAAVMGIIITMGSIDGPLTLIGVKVAAALVGTFIGIFACYCMFDPLATALEHLVDRHSARLRCMTAILVMHSKGKPALLCIDAGRRQIQSENRPSFIEVERWLEAQQL